MKNAKSRLVAIGPIFEEFMSITTIIIEQTSKLTLTPKKLANVGPESHGKNDMDLDLSIGFTFCINTGKCISSMFSCGMHIKTESQVNRKLLH